jgi:hypothetical protein
VEPEIVRRVATGPPPSFVDQPVVGVAQEDEVVEVRGPSVGPVDEVVGVQPPLPFAPGEPAPPAVAMSEDPVDRLRDLTTTAPNPHRPPLGLQHPLDPRVASQPADRLGGKAMATLGLG